MWEEDDDYGDEDGDDEDGRPYQIYRLKRKKAAGKGVTLNIIGGTPPGVDANRWPTFDGEPMTHLFTLDVNTTPELRPLLRKDVRSISLFCWHPDLNEASTPNNPHTQLILTTEEQLASKAVPPKGYQPTKQSHFEAVVAKGQGDAAITRVLGDPAWIQEPEYAGTFLMQFDEGFCDINLGDGGMMYVFLETSFWQCM